MIAALYVQTDGCYFGLQDVDPWDIHRDARKYNGPHAVVAHPPCQRWGNLWWSARHKGLGLGDDEGCFKAALASVRKFGGVLEHPSGSRAWPRYGLTKPNKGCQWTPGAPREWTAEVYQRNYGHRALKKTWLFYVGDQAPMDLDWSKPMDPEAYVTTDRPMKELRARGVELMGKKERAATPIPFRDLLLELARHSRKS